MTDEVTKEDAPLLEKQEEDEAIVMEEDTGKSSLVLAFSFILATVAIVFSAYVYWLLQQQTQQSVTLKSELTEIANSNKSDAAINALDDKIKNQTNAIAAIESQLSGNQLTNNNRLNELKDSIADLSANKQPVSKDYLLSELEHLLILANNNIRIAGDVDTAITALQAVENRLQHADGNDLLILREQVINDLASLQSVNNVDTKGLSLYLANMAANTESLPVANLFREDEKTQQEIKERDTSFESVNDFLSTLWADIKAMILVTPEVNQAEAVMLRGESYFLKHNLRLELLTARIAVLNKDTENFQTSVKQSTQWLNDYFDNADAAVVNMHDALVKMQDIQLSPPIPDISSSLESLRALMRERENVNIDTRIVD